MLDSPLPAANVAKMRKITSQMLILLSLIGSTASAQTKPMSKKLIEFGWDEPNTEFMRKHISQMEQTPFDGTVFTIQSSDAKGQRGDFLGQGWGNRKFTEAELAAATDDLKKTPFKRFTENFLRFDVTPGDVDWFDDFSAITNNARLAAKVAHEGKARGILFDTEPYGKPLWKYPEQRDGKTKSFDDYAKQARQRGREVMNAFQEGYGDNVTIFMTFGQSLVYAECSHDPKKLPEISYGLLNSFLDGMVEVAKPTAKIVDGYEMSYAYKEPKEFTAAEQTVHKETLAIVADPEKYKAITSLGFGLWMDQDWRKNGWDINNFNKNYFTPEAFGESVRMALATSDRYLWIYTEKPLWWSEKGSQLLPPEYVNAIQAASSSK